MRVCALCGANPCVDVAVSHRPLRIALLVNLAPKKLGSLEDWLVAMATAAAARGHHLDLFVHDPTHPLVRERLLKSKAGLYHVSQLLSRPVRSGRWLSSRYDVIQLHLWGPRELIALIALSAWPTKVLYVDHFSGGGTGPEVRPGPLRHFINRMTAVPFAGFAGVSNYVRDRLKQRFSIGESKVRTIYNGVDVERFRSDPRNATDATVQVLAVSQLIPEKGLDVLLRAVAITQLHVLRVVIAGEGVERVPLECLAMDLGISSQVSFVGVRNDIEALLNQCDLFVHPATWQEAFGLVVAEAMAAGRPVIATHAGALPELVLNGETGLLVEPGDPSALAGALIRLAKDQGLRQRMGANGQARMQQFSLMESVRHNLDWCEEVVSPA